MNLKVWYLISSSFMFYSLLLLFDERYKVNYHLARSGPSKFADSFDIYSCIWINELLRWKKLALMELNEGQVNTTEPHLETNVIVSKFLQEAYDFLDATFRESLRKANISYPENYEMPLQRSDRFIYINHVCYRLNQTLLSNLRYMTRFNHKIFSNRLIPDKPDRRFMHFLYRVRNSTSFSFFKISNIITQHLEPPYSTCANERTIRSKRALSKFDCMNICLKSKHRHNLYLYTADDNDYLNLSSVVFSPNDSRACRLECAGDDCTIELFMSVQNVGYKIYNTVYQAYLATSELEFCLQFFGLAGLFLNISVNETVPVLLCSIVNYLVSKFRSLQRETIHQRALFSAKAIVLLISLTAATGIGLKLIYDYHQSLRYPILTDISVFTNEDSPYAVILCIPVQFLVNGQIGGPEEDLKMFQNFTFEKLVNLTNGGHAKLVNNIQMTYGSKIRSINHTYSRKVYFRKSPYDGQELFSRCFWLDIKRTEMPYQSLLTVGSLVIHLKNNSIQHVSTYLVHPEKEFNLQAYLYERKFKVLGAIIESIETSWKTNCTNEYSENSKCFSRSSCTSMCIGQRYLESHKSLPTNTLIDEDFFSGLAISKLRFNHSIDSKINNECEKLHMKPECRRKVFLPSYKMQVVNEHQIEINLCFETLKHQEQPISLVKLVFSLINLVGIFFGLNLIKVSHALSRATASLLRFRQRNYLNKQITLAVCSLGFLIHVFVIFDGIVSGDYIMSGFYNESKSTDLPDLVFCFKFQSKVDPAHKLTGRYLNELTSDMTFETLFANFSFLNERKEVEFLSPKQLLASENFGKHVFYFFNMKCLTIHPRAAYEAESYYFSEYLYPFKVHLSKEAKQNDVIFIGKKKGSKDMNELYKFQFSNDEAYSFRYLVTIVPLEITVVDIFKYLKNPLSLLLRILGQEQDFTEPTEYFRSIEQTTKSNYGFTTKTFPLVTDESTDLDHEIHEALFMQFIKQKQEPSDAYHQVYSPNKLNSRREIFHTYIQLSRSDPGAFGEDEPDVEFLPSAYVQHTRFTNAESYASFLQSLLNSISLFYGVCILQFHLYLSQLANAIAVLASLMHRKLNLLKNKFDVFI